MPEVKQQVTHEEPFPDPNPPVPCVEAPTEDLPEPDPLDDDESE